MLLDNNPRHLGRISLLQVAAPSRGQLPAYQALQQHTSMARSGASTRNLPRAIGVNRVIDEHQPPLRVYELYRATDFCLVNSLHDGMNLVAKEFVAARDDGWRAISEHLSPAPRASWPRRADQSLRCHVETANAMEVAMHMGRMSGATA